MSGIKTPEGDEFILVLINPKSAHIDANVNVTGATILGMSVFRSQSGSF